MSFSRRRFLQATAAAGIVTTARGASSRPKILLRSSWQTVNIGDIGHTPGWLTLLEKHLPEAEVWLWPSKVDNGVAELLTRRFPRLKILGGESEVKQAFAECQFLLHSSGASFVAEKDVRRWVRETGKPFGVAGITFASTKPETIELLSQARFAYFRDTVSLKFAREHGVQSPVMEFGPDGAFGVDLRNDEPAKKFLSENHLSEGQFVCCIPRLRFTPYWLIKPNTPLDPVKQARNEAMKEHDHAPLRAAIEAVVRETELKVLLCPEDASQMAVGKELIYDKLPDEVKARVVWREQYWLTDEALSTYVRSAGLFGNEMHSPIMCVGNGVPAIVCRFDEQTSKGLMWRDIGLGEWLFNLDEESEVARVPGTVVAMASDAAAAKARTAEARTRVQALQAGMMKTLGEALG